MSEDTFDKYGIDWPVGTSDETIELKCYRYHSSLNTGYSKSWHMKRAIQLLWPEEFPDGRRGYVFSDWSHMRIEAWCEPTFRIGDEHYQTWWGPSSTGKSTDAGVIILTHWLSAPLETTVTVCSTTRPMLKKRIWSEIIKFYSFHSESFPGEHQRSNMCILFDPEKNEKAGIFGIAVQKGTVEEAVGNIVGVHNDYNVLVIDEMQATRQAAVDAFDNLSTGLEAKFLGMGNPVSRLDPLGKASKPLAGWKNVQMDMPAKWETEKGKTLFFDGRKSPGVRNPKLYPYLLTQKQINDMKRDPGEDSPRYWSQRIGFVPPEGLLETVLSESLVVKFDMQGYSEWEHGFQMIAALDESFTKGGDRCVLTPAAVGLCTDGTIKIEFRPPIHINLKLSSGLPVEYYIASQVKKQCEALGIKPVRFGMDSSATQTALCSIIEREWGKGIYRCQFAGKASELPTSLNDERPAYEVYQNRVTELWYNMREFGISNQIRGLSNEAVLEFCQRLIINTGQRIQVEPKKEMKSRTNKSPDYADSAVIALGIVRERLNIHPGLNVSSSRQKQKIDDLHKKYDLDSSDNLYASAPI